ncbi:hypothetical protein DPMN_187193 [Dreissena polymorpha]|uniref:Uncharacterized protein n=1 Tax=Dreissena polymorpha TaxID=45954 RepID=A0A9D4DR30_DREPO|nr:hypothetical protein DPMN_187193 [Dreissena polymorpha]
MELLYLQEMDRRINSNRVERRIPNQPQFLIQLPRKLPVEEDLIRRWRCIGHTTAYTCMQYDKKYLTWDPKGKGREGGLEHLVPSHGCRC